MTKRFHRRSIRLQGYDYTRAGAYHVTVCTEGRLHLFGDVVDEKMVMNAFGTAVQRCWDAIPEHMPMVVLDEFVVMPNHVHGVIVITERAAAPDAGVVPPVGAGNFPPLRGGQPGPTDPPPPDNPDVPPKRPIAIMVKNSLGHIMQTFKAAVSRQAYRDGLLPRGTPVWQRGYYEHIPRMKLRGATRPNGCALRNTSATTLPTGRQAGQLGEGPVQPVIGFPLDRAFGHRPYPLSDRFAVAAAPPAHTQRLPASAEGQCASASVRSADAEPRIASAGRAVARALKEGACAIIAGASAGHYAARATNAQACASPGNAFAGCSVAVASVWSAVAGVSHA